MPDGSPYPTAGRLVGRWIQRGVVHGEGDALGQRVRLTPWDWYILDRIFQYDPLTGQLLYHHVLIGVGKGNSKTEACARIGLAELAGPIAPVSPRVILSAASYDQTRELYTAARLGITGTPDSPAPLAPFFREGDHILENRILLPEGHGLLERIAAVAGTTDGGKPSCHIGDEIHEWTTEGQERVYTVQSKSLRKRRVLRKTPPELGLPPGVQLTGALQIGISTAGATTDSLLGRLYEHGLAVASGEIDDPAYLFLWWEADERWDLEDPAQRRQAILEANPNAGTFLPVENIEDSYRDPTVPRIEFVRYNLNRFPTGSDALIPSAVWAARAGTVKLSSAEPTYASVVISHDHRSAAIAVVQRSNSAFALHVRSFDGSMLPDGDALALATLEEYALALHRAYPARVLAPVRFRPGGPERQRPVPGPILVYSGAFFEGSAQRLRASGMALENQPLSPQRLAPAVKAFHGLILDEQLTHDGDQALADSIANLGGKPTPTGWTVEPTDPRRPTAPAYAAMVAVYRAMTSPRPPGRRMRIE